MTAAVGGSGQSCAESGETTILSAASKRAHSDEMLSRLDKNLCTTTDAKKRLVKILRLLPKCSAPDPQPGSGAAPSLSGKSANGGPSRSGSSGSDFPFKLLRTPKTALPTTARSDGPEEEARRRLRQHRFGDPGANAQEETAKAR
jgi:hypothetical protein